MDPKSNEQIPANDPLFTPQAKYYDSPYNKNMTMPSPYNQNALLMTPIGSNFKNVNNNNLTPFKQGNIMNPSSAFKSPNIRNLFNSESKTCEKVLFQNEQKDLGDFKANKRSSFNPDNKIFGEKNLGHLQMTQPFCQPFPLFGNPGNMYNPQKYLQPPFVPIMAREEQNYESGDEEVSNSPYKNQHCNNYYNMYGGFYPGMYPNFPQYPVEFQKQLFQQQQQQQQQQHHQLNNISDIFQNPVQGRQQSQLLQNSFYKQSKQKKMKNKQHQALTNTQHLVQEQQMENLKKNSSTLESNNTNSEAQQYQLNNNQPPNLPQEQTPGKKTKTCNCKKTKCLKLYCDCFAGGELCGPECNCHDCFNTTSHSQVRHEAMTTILEKYPDAFSGKIQKQGQKQQHKKGCNCRRSGCQKKYCECYSAGIECSDFCKCGDQCKNIDAHNMEKRKQKEIEDNLIGLEKSESLQQSSQQQLQYNQSNINSKRQSEFEQIESTILKDMQELPENDTLLKTPLTSKKQFKSGEIFNSADKVQGENSPLQVQKNLNGQFQSTVKKVSFIKPEKTNNNIQTPKPSDIQALNLHMLQNEKEEFNNTGDKNEKMNHNNNIIINNTSNIDQVQNQQQQKIKLVSKDSGVLQSALSTTNNSSSQDEPNSQVKQEQKKVQQNLIIVQQKQELENIEKQV